MTTKRNKLINSKSRTKKCRPNQLELKQYCRESANTYNKFEKDLEQTLKKKGLWDPNFNVEAELVKMFKIPFAPSKYTPRNDYYTYINYQWMDKKGQEIKKNQKYYVQADSFRIKQEEVYYDLMDMVKEYIKTNKTPRRQSLKNLYESLLNLDNATTASYVGWAIERMNKIYASNSLYRMLAEINQNEIISWGCPIVWSVMPDEKNSKIYRSYISAPQLSAYDYDIYIENTKDDQNTKLYKKLFKQHYIKYIEDMFNACLGKNHGHKASDVWDVECDILGALGCNKIKKDDENGYNLVYKTESINKCGLDWSELATQIGYKDVPDRYICNSLNYVSCILSLLTKDDTWKSKKWTTYYLYIILRQLIRFHSEWRQIHYEFNEKFVKGQPVPWPKDIYPVFGLSICFNNLLSKEYIKRHKKQAHIDYIKNMAEDLLIVYKRIIKRNTWLSPKTKQYALQKLDHINLIIGSPEILDDDPLLAYKSKGAYQNLKKIAMSRTRKFMLIDGKSSNADMPIIDWSEFKLVGKQPYIVNAYYTPSENSIYIPSAYMQKPFIDLDERGIEYNLAHVGFTLGHEMSHCLDDLGSQYDYKGNLFNWWTKEDRDTFNKKVNDVIKQYETFASYDGIKMDASLSTGENLADISGLAICEEYLRDFQQKNEDEVSICALSYQAFFTYFAIQARQKIFDEAIKAQLKTNPHPLDKYRTNCPLARLELFRSLYNIKKGDKMYWPSMDTIW